MVSFDRSAGVHPNRDPNDERTCTWSFKTRIGDAIPGFSCRLPALFTMAGSTASASQNAANASTSHGVSTPLSIRSGANRSHTA